MKFNLCTCMILLAMTISFGCGNKKTPSPASSAQNTLISSNGLQVASGSSSLVGNWSGYIESDFATITISLDGSVQISAKGKTIQEKLVKDDQNEIFITDTIYDQLLSIDLLDESFTMFAPNGSNYSFTKN